LFIPCYIRQLNFTREREEYVLLCETFGDIRI